MQSLWATQGYKSNSSVSKTVVSIALRIALSNSCKRLVQFPWIVRKLLLSGQSQLEKSNAIKDMDFEETSAERLTLKNQAEQMNFFIISLLV